MHEPFWQWLLQPEFYYPAIALAIGLAVGYAAGRLRKSPTGQGRTHKGAPTDDAFFKGVQYILSDDHDHAIEEFTKSVQINSDTVETYVALGNLYRSKGDIERAIRIRQSLILRPNLDNKIRLRALFDLALDYKKGGFLDRALKTLLEVENKNPSDVGTLTEIERIYEELGDWESAYKTRQKIAKLSKGDHSHILAHHLVEMGKKSAEQEDFSKAKAYFNKAININEKCVDAYLHLGDLYFSKRDYKKAISSWKKVVYVTPEFTFLAYKRLEGAYTSMKNLKPVGDFLKECSHLHPDAFTHLALSRYLYNEGDLEGALKELKSALTLSPHFWEARRFQAELLLSEGKHEEALKAYEDLVQHLDVPYLKFQCANCGFEPGELHWRCPQCKSWDTIGLQEAKRSESVQAHHSLAALASPAHGARES